MNTLISVIIPIYNVEKYVADAICSVVRQTHTNWELLLIDDGSTDRSGCICDDYASRDARIHVFHTTNGGLSHARNVGLSHAHGDWIQFLDGDDYLAPHALETLLRHSDGVDAVVGGICEVPKQQLYRCVTAPQTYNRFSDIAHNLEHLYNNGIISAWSKLYRADSLQIRFDETIHHAEDLPFALEYLPTCNGIRLIPDILFYYRVIPGELTLSKRFWLDTLDIFAQAINLAATHLPGCPEATAYLERRFALEACKYFVSLVHLQSLSKAEKLLYLSTQIHSPELSCYLKKRCFLRGRRWLLWHILRTRNPRLIYRSLLLFGRLLIT